MAGENIASAVQEVATSVDKSGSMGIKGLALNNIGNVAAMAIIAGAFLYLGRDMVAQSKEDRVMFRDELKALRLSQEARWEKTDISHGRAMEKMGNTVEKAVGSLDDAVREMKVSNEEAKKIRILMGSPKGPGG